MMKKILLVGILVVGFKFMTGQKLDNQIEINPCINMNWYPEFQYSINSVSSNNVKIRGVSWGINIGYKFPVQKTLFIKAGFGYYKYSFNKIYQVNSSFSGHSHSRVIDGYHVPGPITPALIFSTNRYFYNTILLNTGMEKQFSLHNNMKITTGFEVHNYYTFSQLYHVTYPSPGGDNFKTTENHYFGFSANLTVGLQKQYRELSIGPVISVPVYNNWKQDAIFPQEENYKSRKKWFGGFGLGISFNYFLANKRRWPHK